MRRGFSLIEFMIVLLIFSIIMGSVFSVMTVSKTSWYSGSTQIEVQQETRRGMDRMVKELRQTNPTKITGVPANGTPYNSISFRLSVVDANGNTTWSSTINYSLGGLNNQQILRTENSQQEVLANNIINLQFERSVSTSNVLEINLLSQKSIILGHNIGTSLTSQIKLRN